MTRDELIAYIDDSTNGLKHKHLFEKLLANTKALRAVVELHKSKLNENDNQMFCVYCSSFSYRYVEYPCPEIEAIEKELG